MSSDGRDAEPDVRAGLVECFYGVLTPMSEGQAATKH
jgi:hypothetical protein